jgi:hypothetical protein
MNNTSDIKLLPCPCCGGEAVYDQLDMSTGMSDDTVVRLRSWVMCAVCGLLADSDDVGRSNPIAVWNNRVANQSNRSDALPYPGMKEAFEMYAGQDWDDPLWRSEVSTWAAAWKRSSDFTKNNLS